jgi:hypothetical protein
MDLVNSILSIRRELVNTLPMKDYEGKKRKLHEQTAIYEMTEDSLTELKRTITSVRDRGFEAAFFVVAKERLDADTVSTLSTLASNMFYGAQDVLLGFSGPTEKLARQAAARVKALSPEITERNTRMVAEREAGDSYENISEKYGTSVLVTRMIIGNWDNHRRREESKKNKRAERDKARSSMQAKARAERKRMIHCTSVDHLPGSAR